MNTTPENLDDMYEKLIDSLDAQAWATIDEIIEQTPNEYLVRLHRRLSRYVQDIMVLQSKLIAEAVYPSSKKEPNVNDIRNTLTKHLERFINDNSYKILSADFPGDIVGDYIEEMLLGKTSDHYDYLLTHAVVFISKKRQEILDKKSRDALTLKLQKLIEHDIEEILSIENPKGIILDYMDTILSRKDAIHSDYLMDFAVGLISDKRRQKLDNDSR